MATANFSIRRKVYWIGLLKAIKHLCHYYMRYKSKLPTNLPLAVAAAMIALDVACTEMERYDINNARGEGV